MQQNLSGCLPASSGAGLTVAPSARSAPRAASVSSIRRASTPALSNKSKVPRAVRGSSIPACPPPSRETTSSGRSSTCETIILTNIPDRAMTSATSVLASTSRGPDFYAYWDLSRQDLYQKLLWPLETASPGSASSSSSGSARSFPLSSSFLTTLTELPKRSSERTSCPSYRYTVVDGTVDGGTEAGPPPIGKIKTLKLRLRPTQTQRDKLAQWAGSARVTYNRAVAIRLAEGSTQRNVFRIRDRLVTLKKRGSDAKNTFFDNKPWLLDCPKSIRMDAVKSAVANVKSCFSNHAAGNIDHFNAPFRSKKDEKLHGWSLGMDQKNVGRDGDSLSIFPDMLDGPMKYCSTKQLRKLLPESNPVHDPKIQRSAYGEYFLVLGIDVRPKSRKTVRAKITVAGDGMTVSLKLHVDHPQFAAASLDPGVRKTLATYSPENEESFLIGKGQATDLSRLLITYDKMLSVASQTTEPSERRKHAEVMMKLRKRIFYLKKEYRDQTANFLARRYDILLVPKLGTKDMTLCAGRKLKTKVVRQMLTLGHSSIFSRLREKCAEYGTQFLEVKEHYTSQTCVRCGHLNKCGETFKCSQCHHTCDRDLEGAAGIFLKAVRRTNPSMTA